MYTRLLFILLNFFMLNHIQSKYTDVSKWAHTFWHKPSIIYLKYRETLSEYLKIYREVKMSF